MADLTETDSSMRVTVVLPAGGSGLRMGLPTPKQYCYVQGRPLMSHTIEAFEKMPIVDHIVVAVAHSKLQETEEMIRKYAHKKVHLVEGDSTRHRSIFNAVKGVRDVCSEPDVIVIHDIVRPFVDQQIVQTVAIEAKGHGAAGAIRPLTSTVIATDQEGFLDRSLDRSKYRASEMPQAFRYDVIRAAYEKSSDHDLDYGTECLHLVDKYMGVKARLVEGPVSLWKVTVKKDLYAVDGMLKERSNKIFISGCDPVVSESFHSCVEEKNMQIVSKAEEANNIVTFGGEGEDWEGSFAAMERHDGSQGIYVRVEAHSDPKQTFWHFYETIRSRAKQSQHCHLIITGIITTNDINPVDLAKKVCSVVFERSETYNGQVLILS